MEEKKECIVCGNKFTPKNKKGVYCSSVCRQKDYRRRLVPVIEKGRKSDANIEVTDLTTPAPVLKPKEQPKTNFTIHTKPRNLDELKALCPFPERSDERSQWVRTERQKYGI